MLDADPDEGMIAELDTELTAIGGDLESFRLKSLLSGPDDARPVHPDEDGDLGFGKLNPADLMPDKVTPVIDELRGWGPTPGVPLNPPRTAEPVDPVPERRPVYAFCRK